MICALEAGWMVTLFNSTKCLLARVLLPPLALRVWTRRIFSLCLDETIVKLPIFAIISAKKEETDEKEAAKSPFLFQVSAAIYSLLCVCFHRPLDSSLFDVTPFILSDVRPWYWLWIFFLKMTMVRSKLAVFSLCVHVCKIKSKSWWKYQIRSMPKGYVFHDNISYVVCIYIENREKVIRRYITSTTIVLYSKAEAEGRACFVGSNLI